MEIPPEQRYWSRFFGVDAATFEVPGVRVVPHAALRGYHGLWIFQSGPGLIISVPDELVDVASVISGIHDPDSGVAEITGLLGTRIARVIGPVFQGHATAVDFRRPTGPVTTRLAQKNAADLARLAAACGAEAWEHGGVAVDGSDAHLFGCYTEGHLVAVGKNEPVGEGVFSDLGVVTDPAWRGRGFGTAVVAAAMEDGFRTGDLAMYQTLEANYAAVGVARRLGFRQHARNIAMRLR